MVKLKNELSWSRTRITTLERCHRQYYIQYYQKWGGWEWSAAPEKKRAYELSNMTNLAIACGDVVHRTIKRILEEIRDYGEVRTDDPALHARKLLSGMWRDAQDEKWRTSSKKHPPFFELTYGLEPDAAALKAVGARVADCLENFFETDLFTELLTQENRQEKWIAIDPEPSFDDDSKFKVDGRTVWALPDFARINDAGECEVWDWKTGRPREADRMQLMSYALYMADKAGFERDNIRIFGCYLAEGELKEYEAGPEGLAEIEARIKADFQTLEGLLTDVPHNVPGDKETTFPMTTDQSKCQSCFFKELCER